MSNSILWVMAGLWLVMTFAHGAFGLPSRKGRAWWSHLIEILSAALFGYCWAFYGIAQ